MFPPGEELEEQIPARRQNYLAAAFLHHSLPETVSTFPSKSFQKKPLS
jgi:hypothetical protein